jgi:lipopolysaccharide export system protein LptA
MTGFDPWRGFARTFLALLAVVAGAASAGPGVAQVDAPLDFRETDAPIEVEAEQGIEWRRDDNVYIARGNVRATRGDLTVYAETLTAHYREKSDGGTRIWLIEAVGQVRLASPGRTVYGDKATYDLDQALLTLTGSQLRIETAQEIVTAEESLEYREGAQVAVARGNALAERNGRYVRADILTANFERRPDGKLDLVRLRASGHVRVKAKDTLAQGAMGDYDLRKDIATLTGGVKITTKQAQLDGESAEVNLSTGVFRMQGGKVKTLILPTPEQAP